ncbi:hypothetical protein JMA_11530 [Jeotgalibacillus malaysiensis]|uniref:VWFA domain-containing protein n=1 Tax=Jeotgalibacillus malaysiensis TaxID=1508404 RepID=A0A0B5AJD9_9BACL|nr:vWA domain-containing protein [Jeotgalibacillus malaysiensis]AJD90470.1 hypothetical protein JMA_11530 [Jeotgalibacillus malaysiensis]
MNNDLTELVFILDKSGSMGGLESDTIGGYNSMLEKQKKIKGECNITTVLFDHHYELLYDRINVSKIDAMTEKEYQVGGSTALLDAVGVSLHKMISVQKLSNGTGRADKVMFVIITDGEENSSREYSADHIKSLIEQQKENHGWEFIFLGANLDAAKTAQRYGISSDRAINYVADHKGTQLNYKVMSQASASFREEGIVDESCLDEIREDVKQRRKQF